MCSSRAIIVQQYVTYITILFNRYGNVKNDAPVVASRRVEFR